MQLRLSTKGCQALRALTLGLLIAAAQLPATPFAHAQQVETLRMELGDTKIMKIDFDLTDVVIGNEQVASVTILSPESLVITPLAAGETKIVLLDATGAKKIAMSLMVMDDFSQLQAIIDEVVAPGSVEVRNVNGRVLVSGSVQDQASAGRIMDIASSYSEGAVIDAIKVADPRQVMLKVNILELSRNGGKELGINTFRNPAVSGSVLGAPFGQISQNLTINSNGNTYSIDFLLQALETRGLARRLANPTLVSSNGSTASFLVGGEVPVVITESSSVTGGPTVSDQSTTYREYGVKLAFTPNVMPDQSIRLRIMPEVSEVDWTKTVNGNPAFVSRKVDTNIELKSGESFAIAGLLQSNSLRNVRQFPWIANVPILGTLFRSSAYQNNQTELVILVTPYLVNGASKENLDANPLSQGSEPNDAEAFVFGAIEDREQLVRAFKNGFGVSGAYGHILPSP
ncbi:type II and III secretion system protein family protein [Tabrizicola sp.]|uniref:type II and III secretion system protein family protein n=1 Tax=Tabrizicola sp. TaxID=2005166 RepID=UPI003D26E01B